MLTGQPGSTAGWQHCHVQKVMEIEDDMGGPDPSLGNGNETTTVSTVEQIWEVFPYQSSKIHGSSLLGHWHSSYKKGIGWKVFKGSKWPYGKSSRMKKSEIFVCTGDMDSTARFPNIHWDQYLISRMGRVWWRQMRFSVWRDYSLHNEGALEDSCKSSSDTGRWMRWGRI